VVKRSMPQGHFAMKTRVSFRVIAFINLGLGVHAARMVGSAHLKNTGKPAKTLRKTRKHTARKHHKVYIVDKILQKAIQSTRCVALVVHVCC
jgi:hypothetical protein